MFDEIFHTHGHLSDRDLLYTILANTISNSQKLDKIMSVTDDIKADVSTLGTVLGNLLTAAQTASAALAAAQSSGAVSAADAASIKAALDGEIATAQQTLATLTPAAATPPTTPAS